MKNESDQNVKKTGPLPQALQKVTKQNGSPALAKKRRGKNATVTANPEGAGWVMRVGSQWIRDDGGAIKQFETAAEAKKAAKLWRDEAREALGSIAERTV